MISPGHDLLAYLQQVAFPVSVKLPDAIGAGLALSGFLVGFSQVIHIVNLLQRDVPVFAFHIAFTLWATGLSETSSLTCAVPQCGSPFCFLSPEGV